MEPVVFIIQIVTISHTNSNHTGRQFLPPYPSPPTSTYRTAGSQYPQNMFQGRERVNAVDSHSILVPLSFDLEINLFDVYTITPL